MAVMTSVANDLSAQCIGEDLSANNREYMVLEGSEGRKVISNKNEPKQFKSVSV